MSLFDDDLSSSSSSSSDDSLKEKTVSHRPASLLASGALRFTLTAEDAQRAEERRRKELTGGLLMKAAKSDAINASGMQGSRFHASIAETLQKRQEAREEVLLRRIKKQRQEEANSLEFVEKDLEVGVFVTPQYLSAQKRHARTTDNEPEPKQKKNPEKHDANERVSTAGDDDDAADDPIEAYVRHLEAQRSAPLPAALDAPTECDVPIQSSSAPLHEPVPGPVAVPGPVPGPGPIGAVDVQQPCLSSPLPVHGKGERGAERSEEVLREARESHKRVRVDRAFVEAAAVRFNVRAWERILQQ